MLVGSGLLTVVLLAATVALTATVPTTTAPVAAPANPAGTVSAQVAYGARLFAAKGCGGCHETGTVGLVGPSLSGISRSAGTRRPGSSAEAYIRESIRRPQAFRSPLAPSNGIEMPTLEVTDAELDALVAYLLSLP
ncbi:MAG TPA: cytochrome c [Candidatus Saccharimonadales bacterium]|nr:cytochrome c [Candidatus Saccharimonadales bacterium]